MNSFSLFSLESSESKSQSQSQSKSKSKKVSLEETSKAYEKLYKNRDEELYSPYRIYKKK